MYFNIQYRTSSSQFILEEMMHMYDDGKLFELSEWHDSYTFDHVRKKLEKKYFLKNINITNLELLISKQKMMIMYLY